MVEWSELPRDLLESIARKFTLLTDNLRFSSVCWSWRRAGNGSRRRLPPQLPGLLFREYKRKLYSFFSLSQRRVHKSPLDMRNRNERCRGSSGGWLISIGYEDEIHLINPFAGAKYALPPITTLCMLLDDPSSSFPHIRKAALARTQTLLHECVVVVIHGGQGRLSFGRSIDDAWTLIENCQWHPYEDVIYCKEKFYAVNHEGTVVVCDIGPHSKVTEFAPPLKADLSKTRYLVESMGELFQVVREKKLLPIDYDDSEGEYDDGDKNEANDNNDEVGNNVDDNDGNDNGDDDPHDGEVEIEDEFPYKTVGFEIFKFDPSGQKWVEVKSLGERILFLGGNCSFSLSTTDFPECKGNCIYFTDDYWEGYDRWGWFGGHDMGMFNLEDRSIEPFYPNNSGELLPWPIWIEPNPW